MSIIKRKWTPAEADHWTKEDWITIVISCLSYFLLTLGTGLSLLFLPAGYITLAAGIILTVIMHWIIDPKLKVVSEEYEKKQHQYLEELEKNVRWEGEDG